MSQIVPAQKIKTMLTGPKMTQAVLSRLKDKDAANIFVQSLWLSVQRTPELLKCTPESLIIAGLQAASLNLIVDGHSNYAHIVPYGTQATFVIGYKGIQLRATRTKRYVEFELVPVFKGDEFSYVKGLDPRLEHIPADVDRTWATLTHVYSIVERADGKKGFHVMTKAEISKVMEASRASKNGPWVAWPIEMSLKTVAKRHCKQLNLDPDTMREIIRDDRREAGEPDPEGAVIDVEASDVAEIVSGAVETAEAAGTKKAATKLDKVVEAAKQPAQVAAAAPAVAVEDPPPAQEAAAGDTGRQLF